MKLSVWAKRQGITYCTAYRWFRQGHVVGATQMPTGTILVPDVPVCQPGNTNEVVIYARVSSVNKKDDLRRQVKRCEQFCRDRGYHVKKVIKEVASGMNDKRPLLMKLLKEPCYVVVEHKDRMTRFGFNYIQTLYERYGGKVTVINGEAEEQTDLMKDLVAVITSFCCRLYGLRRGTTKAKQVKEIVGTASD